VTGSSFVILIADDEDAPGATVPRSSVGETVIPGSPVPATGTTTIPWSELIVRSAVNGAALAGWKITATVAVAPPATTVGNGAAAMNAPASLPPIAGALSVTELRSRFLIVTFNERVVPSGAERSPGSWGPPSRRRLAGVPGRNRLEVASALSSVSCSVTDAPPGFRS